MKKNYLTKLMFLGCAAISLMGSTSNAGPAKNRKPAQDAMLPCNSKERASAELNDRAGKDSGSNSCAQTEFMMNTPVLGKPGIFTAIYTCPVNQNGQALEKTYSYNYTSYTDASGQCVDEATPVHSFLHPSIMRPAAGQ